MYMPINLGKKRIRRMQYFIGSNINLLKDVNIWTELNTVQVAAAVRATGDYPERLGEPPCQV